MSIEFSCGHCGTHLRVGDEKAGVEAACPKCGQPIRIPLSTEEHSESLGDDPEASVVPSTADSETWNQALHDARLDRAELKPSEDGPFRPQTVIVWMLTLGMASMLITNFASTAGTFYQWSLLNQLQQGQDVADSDLELSDVLVGGAAILYLLAFLATCICWMVWKSGANRNARRLSDQPLEYTPGWTIGSYFVPFANLVWPYQAMKEIWTASAPTGTSPGLVGWWWGLWLVNGALGRVNVRMARDADTIEGMQRSNLFDLAVFPVEVAVIFVAGFLVWRIHQMQLVKAGFREEPSGEFQHV